MHLGGFSNDIVEGTDVRQGSIGDVHFALVLQNETYAIGIYIGVGSTFEVIDATISSRCECKKSLTQKTVNNSDRFHDATEEINLCTETTSLKYYHTV